MASAALAALSLVLFAVNAATTRRLTVPRSPAVPPEGAGPRISVVVPARDEARGIEEAVRSHLAQDYANLEVIVVDDRSSDGTAAILARLAASNPRLVVVSGVEPPAGWLGKPHALHQGATRASGELLLFADADVVYAPTAASAAASLLDRERLDLVAFLPRVEMKGFWENVLMPYLAGSFYFGPAFLFNSDRQRRFAAGGGAGMLVRAAAYRASGGHEALKASVIDDLHLAIRVKRSGGRCRMVRADDHVRLRMYRGFREIFDGFTKNMAFVFEGWLGAFLAASTAFSFLAWTLPAAVLLLAAAGVAFPGRDVTWAAAGVILAVAARVALAVHLRYSLWPSLTQPFMAVVWTAITVRSLTWRFLHRELRWRGRSYPAARAGF